MLTTMGSDISSLPVRDTGEHFNEAKRITNGCLQDGDWRCGSVVELNLASLWIRLCG